jgi:hypothetical protein
MTPRLPAPASVILTCTLALALAPAAPAQDDASAGASADITGEWVFETAPIMDGCDLGGRASIRPGPSAGDYQCSITAREVCPGRFDFTAKETCVAKRAGDTLNISSRLDSVTPSTDRYYPDNFSLTIIDSSNMKGALFSISNTSARFHRENGPIS